MWAASHCGPCLTLHSAHMVMLLLALSFAVGLMHEFRML